MEAKKVEWSEFKAFVDQKGVNPQYYEYQNRDHIYAFDGPFSLYCRLRLDPSDSSDITDWQTNYKPNANERLESVDSTGTPLMAQEKACGDFSTVVSHNLCDKNTWEISTTDSTWQISPSAGERLDIVKAEVQFQHDLNLSDAGNVCELYLDYYVWHPVSPGTPVLGQRITFKTAKDIFELGNQHFHAPSLPEISSGLSTVVFDYAHKLNFYGDETYGKLAYLEMSLKDHTEPTGTYATVGFVTNTVMV